MPLEFTTQGLQVCFGNPEFTVAKREGRGVKKQKQESEGGTAGRRGEGRAGES